jgi:hypothetical protein
VRTDPSAADIVIVDAMNLALMLEMTAAPGLQDVADEATAALQAANNSLTTSAA